mgnify:CR=1 FL=1|jgi:hypothetical protein
MGLYGSPELGPYRTDEPPKWQKSDVHIPKWLIWVIAIGDGVVLLLSGISKTNILAIIGFDSLAFLAFGLAMAIYSLFRRQSFGLYVAIVGISIVAFLGSAVAMTGTDGADTISVPSSGSRKNPAKIGQAIQTDVTDNNGLNCTIEIQLTDFRRGEDALKLMQEWGSSGDPGDGKEYGLAKFRVKYLKDKSGKDIPLHLSNTEFFYATGSYKVSNLRWDVPGMDPAIDAQLYEGAEHEGWVCFSVEIDDTTPKAVFIDNIWFDLI